MRIIIWIFILIAGFTNNIFASENDKIYVAMLPFNLSDKVKYKEESDLIYNSFLTILEKNDRYEFIQKHFVEEAIKENNINSYEVDDYKTLNKIKQFVGADYLIYIGVEQKKEKTIFLCKFIDPKNKMTSTQYKCEYKNKSELGNEITKIFEKDISTNLRKSPSPTVAGKNNGEKKTNNKKLYSSMCLNILPFGIGSYYQGDNCGFISLIILDSVAVLGFALAINISNGIDDMGDHHEAGITAAGAAGLFSLSLGLFLINRLLGVVVFPLIHDYVQDDDVSMSRYNGEIVVNDSIKKEIDLLNSEKSDIHAYRRIQDKVKLSVPLMNLSF